MRHSWFRALLRRRLAVIVLLLLQIWMLVYIFNSESYISSMLRTVFHIVSGFLVLYIFSKKDKGAIKVAWLFWILVFA